MATAAAVHEAAATELERPVQQRAKRRGALVQERLGIAYTEQPDAAFQIEHAQREEPHECRADRGAGGTSTRHEGPHLPAARASPAPAIRPTRNPDAQREIGLDVCAGRTDMSAGRTLAQASPANETGCAAGDGEDVIAPAQPLRRSSNGSAS